MNEQIGLIDCPYEIQKRILDKLDEKDHISMYRVSKSWQIMIGQYMTDKNSIKSTDWKWFCRHKPQIAFCSKCKARIQNKKNANDEGNDWEWWLM